MSEHRCDWAMRCTAEAGHAGDHLLAPDGPGMIPDRLPVPSPPRAGDSMSAIDLCARHHYVNCNECCRPEPDDPWHCITHDGVWATDMDLWCRARSVPEPKALDEAVCGWECPFSASGHDDPGVGHAFVDKWQPVPAGSPEWALCPSGYVPEDHAADLCRCSSLPAARTPDVAARLESDLLFNTQCAIVAVPPMHVTNTDAVPQAKRRPDAVVDRHTVIVAVRAAIRDTLANR